jgi:hypothetical protein
MQPGVVTAKVSPANQEQMSIGCSRFAIGFIRVRLVNASTMSVLLALPPILQATNIFEEFLRR